MTGVGLQQWEFLRLSHSCKAALGSGLKGKEEQNSCED